MSSFRDFDFVFPVGENDFLLGIIGQYQIGVSGSIEFLILSSGADVTKLVKEINPALYSVIYKKIEEERNQVVSEYIKEAV